ncbi:hypothetical protein CANCADRAFT_25988 [Tortispora caseinolytica NRRL Y-17796]|uniref:Ubiquitin carboxyl-terminal hydrolase n=1 Tax=Tortispora caseinolytica NRRL Y-17796 TaxID=767744 RepID=A0A1E4TI54_9ASCO|nr:hypothetical protein CANCADRAFT_25988 [Tortispora caseinolytica NRRL Y-17796]
MSRKGKSTAVGLLNHANDCFANSILQALASVPTLRNFLDECDDKQESLACALKEMIDSLNEPITYPKALSVWPFLHELEAIYKSRISRSQHDAHELLHLIFETIHDQRVKSTRAEHADRLSQKKPTSASPATPIVPFESYTQDIITCATCGYTPPMTISSFLVMSLNVPNTWHTTLDKCLASLLNTECIRDFGCDNCRYTDLKRRTTNNIELQQRLEDIDPAEMPADIETLLNKAIVSTIAKKTLLNTLSPILVVHLSRSIFTGTASRNSCRVEIQEYITLTSYQNSVEKTEEFAAGQTPTYPAQFQTPSKVRYRLAAMVRHQGTHQHGHYECYRRKMNHPIEVSLSNESIDGDGQQFARKHHNLIPWKTGEKDWWRISDTLVWECRIDEVLKQTKAAYLLLYEQC